ncbi:MAG: pyridoxal-phosphate dependent enzyme [Phyllobacterium sp.]|uniref:pyridoxal-phosphate dependent enzyme n=1 Tax=Phyllobacterium sp. TaxID=1871046 RepID=UPI0030F1F486
MPCTISYFCASGTSPPIAPECPALAALSGGRVGYGVPTPAMVEAVRLMASREGLLLDPVHGGKAFAGLLADISAGRYAAGDNVLFIVTGGSPGLYAYANDFLGADHKHPI